MLPLVKIKAFDMAEIINLRRARKAKARLQAEADADANRRKHGRTRSERDQAETATKTVERRLDAHKLDTSEPEDG